MNPVLFSEKNIKARYIILFAAWAVLGWMYPYTHDDWYWGIMEYTFPSPENGRYAGHMFSLILTRSRTLRMIVIAITITGIVYCIERIFKKRYAFMIATLSILMMPVPVYRQAIAWTSGFSNYATSAFFLLVFTVYVIEHPSGYRCRKSVLFLLTVLGLINSLLIEHSTVFNVFFSVCVFAFFLIKHEFRWDYASYFSGSILGAMVMFSNPVYRNVVNNTDYYRTVASGGLLNRVKMNYLGAIIHEGCMKNIFLNALLWGLLIMMLLQCAKNKAWHPLKNTLVCFCAAIIGVFVFMTARLFFQYGYDFDLIGNYRLIMSILCLLTFICTVIASMLLSGINGVDYFLLSLWGAFFVMIAPLFAVTPIGGRCFLETYVILILIVCRLVGRIPVMQWTKELRKTISGCALVFIVLLYAGHLYIYGNNCAADLKRTSYIKERVSAGKTTASMERLPFEYYIWYGSPVNEERVEQYKRFYGIPEDFKLVVE